jgi:SAM-dependent methyltransferase
MISDDCDYLAPGGRSFTITSGVLAGLNRRSRVLEIASGRGEAACALAQRFGCRVEGFDIDPGLVEYSRNKAYELGLSPLVEFSVRDGRKEDIGEGFYNLILAEGGALTYIGRDEGLEKCAAHLKDGGYIAIMDLIYLYESVPAEVRRAYEEGGYSYLTEIGYRELLAKHGFEIAHLALVPQSAWDRYYMYMQRVISRPDSPFPWEFKASMKREIDVYYHKGGMQHVAYVYAVARMARGKRVRPGPKSTRVPVLGQWIPR